MISVGPKLLRTSRRLIAEAVIGVIEPNPLPDNLRLRLQNEAWPEPRQSERVAPFEGGEKA